MKIAVYCGANKGKNESFTQAAVALGAWIGEKGNTLVYGGGKVGLMGILADNVLAHKGQVIGVMPTFLQDKELAHTGLTELRTVPTMSERKAMMANLSEAFIALPGGPGTLEEITEMVSWARIGQNPYPCIFFNTDGYYQPLKEMYESMVRLGFLTQTDYEKILFSTSLAEIEQFIEAYEPPKVRTY